MVKNPFERFHKVKEIYGNSSKVLNKILSAGHFELNKSSFTAKYASQKLIAK